MFSGTTTDLVPQLLRMFDELARGKCEEQRHVPAELQKRLSLAQKRKSRATSLLLSDMVPAPDDESAATPTILVEDRSSPRFSRASPTALRYVPSLPLSANPGARHFPCGAAMKCLEADNGDILGELMF